MRTYHSNSNDAHLPSTTCCHLPPATATTIMRTCHLPPAATCHLHQQQTATCHLPPATATKIMRTCHLPPAATCHLPQQQTATCHLPQQKTKMRTCHSNNKVFCGAG